MSINIEPFGLVLVVAVLESYSEVGKEKSWGLSSTSYFPVT